MKTLILYCQSCGSPLNNQRSCQCGWTYQPYKAPLGPIQTVEPRKLPLKAKIGLTIDRTPSSKRYTEATLLMSAAILSGIDERVASMKCWLQSHGDLEDGEQEILHADGVGPQELIRSLSEIEFGGGGDPAETHLDALERLANLIPFTQEPKVARGVIIGIMTDDSKKLRSGVSAEELGERFVQRGLLTWLICEPGRRRLERFREAAQAMVVPISRNPSNQELQQIIATVSASIVATLTTGRTIPLSPEQMAFLSHAGLN